MDGKRKTIEPFVWVEEYTEYGLDQQQQHQQPSPTTRKRKKLEFVGWGSRALIAFLQSIGRDTSQPISQFDVTAIVNEYVERNLLQSKTSTNELNNHNTNKNRKKKQKRVLCDERLRHLFGRKSISRIMIDKLLEPHLAAANQQLDSDDNDYLSFCNEGEEGEEGSKYENSYCPKRLTVELSTPTPIRKSCFAAVIPENIKLVYLKRSLIENILKDDGDLSTFETKIIGSFVRTKSDPNDYLQKHSHCLLQVTGLRVSGTDDSNTKTLLQVSGFIKDIPISVLSDEDLSKEECEDLRRRIKDGMLKRPTVEELQRKARILHEDMTKHWLARELVLLKNLIDRANEKGWRRELFEYLERRELLQTPEEQSRLLRELPEVIAEEIEPETAPQHFPDEVKQRNNSSPGSILTGPREAPIDDTVEYETDDEQDNEFELTWALDDIISEGSRSSMQESQKDVQESQMGMQDLQKEPTKSVDNSHGKSETVIASVAENKPACGMTEQLVVINLSDDDENEEPARKEQTFDENLGSLMWHYLDPQGDIQGPFAITSLKHWSDNDYFPPDFKIWKTGQSPNEAVHLKDILKQVFPN